MTDELAPHIKQALDSAFGNVRPAPNSIILRHKHHYSTDETDNEFEVAILDREDLPVMDMTSDIWVLGIANEELFTEEDYVQKLLAPSNVKFSLSPHARTGNRRHGYWQAEPILVLARDTKK